MSHLFRISYAGVILPHARMEARAGSRERHTPASARLGGQVSIVTSPVSPVKLQPNGKVNHSPLHSLFLVFGASLTCFSVRFQVLTWLTCAETLASVWMQETHTIVDARLDTLAATARNKWMSVHLIRAKMEPHVPII